MKYWSQVCNKLFSKSINLWLDELSPLFSTRVQVILATNNSRYRVDVDSIC